MPILGFLCVWYVGEKLLASTGLNPNVKVYFIFFYKVFVKKKVATLQLQSILYFHTNNVYLEIKTSMLP